MTMFVRSIALVFCASVYAMATVPRASAQVTNHETAGNLAFGNALGCIPLAKATSVYTPADLYPAVAACIREDRLRDAVDLMALGGIYGRFDAQRVADTSAGQATSVLLMQVGDTLTEAQRASFTQALKSQSEDPATMGARCAQVARIGAPTYRPDYMIQHGMAAFTGIKGDGLVPGFDAAATWAKLRNSFLHCDAAAPAAK